MSDFTNHEEFNNELPNLDHKTETIMEWILQQALVGVPPLSPAATLAEEIQRIYPQTDPKTLAYKLVQRESYKNFSTGFITGIGGLVTLPLALPSSLVASWVLQARLVAAIAKLGGHDLEDPRIRKLVMWALFGDAVKEVLKTSSVHLLKRFTVSFMIRLPANVIMAVQRKLGLLLLERATRHGAAGLVKAVPVVGGVVSGFIDAAVLRRIGNTAIEWFLTQPDSAEETDIQ